MRGCVLKTIKTACLTDLSSPLKECHDSGQALVGYARLCFKSPKTASLTDLCSSSQSASPDTAEPCNSPNHSRLMGIPRWPLRRRIRLVIGPGRISAYRSVGAGVVWMWVWCTDHPHTAHIFHTRPCSQPAFPLHHAPPTGQYHHILAPTRSDKNPAFAQPKPTGSLPTEENSPLPRPRLEKTDSPPPDSVLLGGPKFETSSPR